MQTVADLIDLETARSPEAAEDRYAARIRAAWSKSVEGILDAGQALIEAKAELHHGRFEHLVKEGCPFGARTAQMLMRIASHEVLSNPKHVSHLPASWGTLSELSKFEPRELKHAIRNHLIKPDLPRKDVPDLHRRVRKSLGIPVRRPSKPISTQAPALAKRGKTNGKTDWGRLADLAAEGNTSHQIAAIVGVRRDTVAKKAKQIGIVIQADRVVGRARIPMPNRILRAFVEPLEYTAPSYEMIDLSKIDHAVLVECLEIMDEAMPVFTRLHRQLRKEVLGPAESTTPMRSTNLEREVGCA